MRRDKAQSVPRGSNRKNPREMKLRRLQSVSHWVCMLWLEKYCFISRSITRAITTARVLLGHCSSGGVGLSETFVLCAAGLSLVISLLSCYGFQKEPNCI